MTTEWNMLLADEKQIKRKHFDHVSVLLSNKDCTDVSSAAHKNNKLHAVLICFKFGSVLLQTLFDRAFVPPERRKFAPVFFLLFWRWILQMFIFLRSPPDIKWHFRRRSRNKENERKLRLNQWNHFPFWEFGGERLQLESMLRSLLQIIVLNRSLIRREPLALTPSQYFATEWA